MPSWHHHDTIMIPSDGITIVSRWLYDSFMLASWYHHNAIVVLSWYHHDTIMTPLWCHNDTPMIPSRHNHDTITTSRRYHYALGWLFNSYTLLINTFLNNNHCYLNNDAIMSYMSSHMLAIDVWVTGWRVLWRFERSTRNWHRWSRRSYNQHPGLELRVWK